MLADLWCCCGVWTWHHNMEKLIHCRGSAETLSQSTTAPGNPGYVWHIFSFWWTKPGGCLNIHIYLVYRFVDIVVVVFLWSVIDMCIAECMLILRSLQCCLSRCFEEQPWRRIDTPDQCSGACCRSHCNSSCHPGWRWWAVKAAWLLYRALRNPGYVGASEDDLHLT